MKKGKKKSQLLHVRHKQRNFCMKVIVYEIPLKKHQTRSREILEECATRYIPSKQEVSRGFAQIYIVLRDRLNACTRTRTHETSSSCGRVLVKRKSNSFFFFYDNAVKIGQKKFWLRVTIACSLIFSRRR